MNIAVAHPVPYQGSKRKIASAILKHFPEKTRTLVEPFAGSAAISLAALTGKRVETVHLNDVLQPLINLWLRIANTPEETADRYAELWEAQLDDPREYYEHVRNEFNEGHCPIKLLYLLARCVKSAVRFNKNGFFNQSADHRRLGAKPLRMRKNILEASRLLEGRLTTSSLDYAELLANLKPETLVYLDPPYQGTSTQKDQRYVQTLDFERLLENIDLLRSKEVPFILSFDGRRGEKTFGRTIPAELGLKKFEIAAGRSSQATLQGRAEETVESLYLSPNLSQA